MITVPVCHSHTNMIIIILMLLSGACIIPFSFPKPRSNNTLSTMMYFFIVGPTASPSMAHEVVYDRFLRRDSCVLRGVLERYTKLQEFPHTSVMRMRSLFSSMWDSLASLLLPWALARLRNFIQAWIPSGLIEDIGERV